jgi:MFS family permease
MSAVSVPARVPSWAAAFGYRDFNRFQAARLFSMIGMQMQSVAIGWQIYATTRRPLDLAWVGLAQFLPAFGFSLFAGQVADRVPRRTILLACHSLMTALSLALFVTARSATESTAPIYAVLVGIGVVRAFVGPANQAILPSLIPTDTLGNAIAWASSFFQVATVLGPVLGGIAYAAYGNGGPVYGAAAAGSVLAFLLIAAMRSPAAARDADPHARAVRSGPSPGSSRSPSSILAGVRYVWSNAVVLGAISLDLFAVLLGGATALLPVYARDILFLGPWALGALRSAPAAGAALTGVALALRPIERRTGAKMLVSVALFGAATIVFGLSRNFVLSLVALVVLGAADMVSVFVRSSLVQLATPDAMRGRVSAVNLVFIGASNELGEFESGVTAQWLGVVPSVVAGGVGTLLVVAAWAWLFPKLRQVDRLTDVVPQPATAPAERLAS